MQCPEELDILPARLLNLLVEEIISETEAAEEAARRVQSRQSNNQEDHAVTDALTAYDHAANNGHMPDDEAYRAGELIGRLVLWIEQFREIWGLEEKDLRRLATEALEFYASRGAMQTVMDMTRLCI